MPAYVYHHGELLPSSQHKHRKHCDCFQRATQKFSKALATPQGPSRKVAEAVVVMVMVMAMAMAAAAVLLLLLLLQEVEMEA